jgi:capsular polysaccharide transport system permease protein
MSGYSESSTSLLASFRTQMRVIGALTLRETSSRFGRENLGFLWLFVEPAMLGGAIGLLHEVTGQSLPGGLEPGIFMITGYIPFYLMRGIINRAPTAIYGTQSLLYHRCITVLDILISKNLLEGAATGGAMLLFLVIFALTAGFIPAHPEYVVFGMLLMLLLCHGLSLVIASAGVFSELVERVTHVSTYLFMGFSGCFWMVFWLPYGLRPYALAIPSVHCFEMLRFGLYGTQVPTYFSLAYVVVWIVGLNLVGMIGLRIARRAMVI